MMSSLVPVLVTLTTFIVMEGVAWLSHKYLMHGAMWYFHEDHHTRTPAFSKRTTPSS